MIMSDRNHHRRVHRATILFILSAGRPVQPGDRAPRQLVRHHRHGDRARRRPSPAMSTDQLRPADRCRCSSAASSARCCAPRRDDPDAGTGRHPAQLRRPRRGAGRLSPASWIRTASTYEGVEKPSTTSRSSSACLSARHLHRFGHRLRQAAGQDRRQADAAAGAPLAEPRWLIGVDLARLRVRGVAADPRRRPGRRC